MSYLVYHTGRLEKSYPFWIQASTYCFLKGYVYLGRGDYFLDPETQIVQIIKEENKNGN